MARLQAQPPVDTVLIDLDGTLIPMDQTAFIRAYSEELARFLRARGWEDARTAIDALMRSVFLMIQNDGGATNRERFWAAFEAALGARVPLHRLLIGGSGAAAVLYVVCALAQSPLLGVLACGLTGLCVSLLWPGAIILASRRIPSAGAAMFALLSAGGDVGASLGAFCVGRAADWAQASGTVFAGAAGESGALRAGLLLAAVFPLLCCGVHTALHCSEARAGLPAGSERRRRQ